MTKTLTPEQRDKRFAKLLDNARQWRPVKYRGKFVAPKFQRMIRAEAGASTDPVPWVTRDGGIWTDAPALGYVICITCGTCGEWSSGGTASQNRGGFHTGHFLAGRGASILFEETNVAPQCAACNRNSGEQERYTIWMRHVYGQDEIDRLRRLKNETRQFSLEELVELRIGYEDRLKAAEELMKCG